MGTDIRSNSMREFRSNSPSSMLLDLDGPGPLHARLAGALRSAIRDGRLRPGSALPPSRVLAAELGCSRWVVTQAYSELATAGYLQTRTGWIVSPPRWAPLVGAAAPPPVLDQLAFASFVRPASYDRHLRSAMDQH